MSHEYMKFTYSNCGLQHVQCKWPSQLSALLNPSVSVSALMTLPDFSLSNARRFYSSMENPLDGKGLTPSTQIQGLICNQIIITSYTKLFLIVNLNLKYTHTSPAVCTWCPFMGATRSSFIVSFSLHFFFPICFSLWKSYEVDILCNSHGVADYTRFEWSIATRLDDRLFSVSGILFTAIPY